MYPKVDMEELKKQEQSIMDDCGLHPSAILLDYVHDKLFSHLNPEEFTKKIADEMQNHIPVIKARLDKESKSMSKWQS